MTPAFFAELDTLLAEHDVGIDVIRGASRIAKIAAARRAVIRLCARHKVSISATADFLFRDRTVIRYVLHRSPPAEIDR